MRGVEQSRTMYFPVLTGLRACAAYLVFWFHYNPLPAGSYAASLLHEGHIGVTIFFVLSGFLIPLRYLDHVEFSTAWLLGYFRNRIARIYPLYALLTCLTFLVIWQWPSFDLTQQWPTYVRSDKVLIPLLHLTFLRSFFQQLKFTGIAAGWTLAVEECFYAFAVPLLLLLTRSKAKYKVLALAAVGLLALGVSIVAALPSHRYGFFDSYQFMLNFTFFGRGVEFMLGTALALYVRQHSSVARVGKWASITGGLWILACMAGLAVVDSPLDNFYGTSSAIGIVLNNAILPVGIILFFYGLLTERTWLQRVLASDLFQLLGKSSYSFYLIHMGVGQVFLYRYVSTNVVLHFVTAVGSALILWYYVEEPLNKWIRTNTPATWLKKTTPVPHNVLLLRSCNSCDVSGIK